MFTFFLKEMRQLRRDMILLSSLIIQAAIIAYAVVRLS